MITLQRRPPPQLQPPLRPAQTESLNPFAKLGAWIATADIVSTFSRFSELCSLAFGAAIPFTVIGPRLLGGVASVLTGGASRVVASPIGKLTLMMTGWLLFLIPLSSWRFGSFNTVVYDWLPNLFLLFTAGGLLETEEQCRRAFRGLALSTSFVAVASFALARFSREDRFQFGWGTLGNPNELATLLLIGLPFWLFPFMTRGGFARLVGLSAIVCNLTVIVKTASRAGLLALIVVTVVFFFYVSAANKIKLLLAVTLLTAIVIAFAPKSSLERFSTTFEDSEGASGEALESKEVRKETLIESIAVTFKHPFFGVGPGVYMDAVAGMRQEMGLRAKWAVTHNSYTQVSAETGLPGFVMFMGALLYTFKNLLWIRRMAKRFPQLQDFSSLTLCLLLSLVGLCSNALFGSYAYQFSFLTFFGFGISFRHAAEVRIRQIAAAVPAAVLTPAVKPRFLRSRPAIN